MDRISGGTSARYEHIKAGNLYDKVKSKVGITGSKAYVDALEEDADAVHKIIHGDMNKWNAATNDMLMDIREVLNVKLSFVPLIAGYHALGGKKKQFEEFVRLIMNFVFRYMKVLDGDVGQLASIMSDVSKMARDGKSNSDIATTLKASAPDGEFAEGFKHIFVANTKLCYFMAYYLELSIMAGAGVQPLKHGTESHLEHIMPRAPKPGNWPSVFDQAGNRKAQFRDYLWRVGNLIPLPQKINTAIKNGSINTKMVEYNKTALHSPNNVNQFLENSEWTFKSIEDRQASLADHHAVSAWELK